MEKTNYWVCGATWNGYDKNKEFVQGGLWILGHLKEGATNQFNRASKMKIGDRIAIKRIAGSGKNDSTITIHHIGIIKGVLNDADITPRIICTVDWIASFDPLKVVASKGCLATVHGPYTMEEEKIWLEQIFCI